MKTLTIPVSAWRTERKVVLADIQRAIDELLAGSSTGTVDFTFTVDRPAGDAA